MNATINPGTALLWSLLNCFVITNLQVIWWLLHFVTLYYNHHPLGYSPLTKILYSYIKMTFSFHSFFLYDEMLLAWWKETCLKITVYFPLEIMPIYGIIIIYSSFYLTVYHSKIFIQKENLENYNCITVLKG